MMMVKATGEKSFPSKPCKLKSGKNTTQMMSTPATTGLMTWRTADNKTSFWESPCEVLEPCACAANAVSMFSTTTTEASTSMPKAMASPPKLMRLAVSPKNFISTKVLIKANGSDTATTTAARMPPKKTYSTTQTNTAASTKASMTVLAARDTNSPRL